MSTSTTTKIELPEELLKKIKSVVSVTEFESEQEYIVFVLQEVVPELEDNMPTTSDEVDEREVKNRLKSLGYLNE
ncbi:hypothetical protein EXE43_10450 [Halorubrum sp. SS5]|nr:hypothetical protein EXE43_10450 [Halorubrum sp. SS5]